MDDLVWRRFDCFIGLFGDLGNFLRKLFNISLSGADELSGYGFGVATTFALSFALLERAHIRVDAVIAVLPKRLHVAINFLGLWLLIGFAFILTAMVWSMVADTLTHGSRSITSIRGPLMIPQLPWLFGWLFFVFTGMLITLVALQRLWRRDRDGVQALIGVKSIDEQIKDESV